MSNFKTSGIVLKIQKQENKNNMIILFSKEFGKINCFIKNSKKEKSLDIGNIISCEINVGNNNINKIQNILIINCIDYQNIDFNTIYEYLNLINEINKYCPYGMPIQKIYDIIKNINVYKKITKEKILFLRIKLYYILGYLSTIKEFEKLSNYINKKEIEEIIKLKGLEKKEIEKLEKILKLNINN